MGVCCWLTWNTLSDFYGKFFLDHRCLALLSSLGNLALSWRKRSSISSRYAPIRSIPMNIQSVLQSLTLGKRRLPDDCGATLGELLQDSWTPRNDSCSLSGFEEKKRARDIADLAKRRNHVMRRGMCHFFVTKQKLKCESHRASSWRALWHHITPACSIEVFRASVVLFQAPYFFTKIKLAFWLGGLSTMRNYMQVPDLNRWRKRRFLVLSVYPIFL